MKSLFQIAGAVSLPFFLGCGGGGSEKSEPVPPTYASELSYQNPVSTGFRLLKNAGASSKTHLVLDLYGPSGTQGKGVAFFLGVDDSKVTWVHPTGSAGTFIAAGSVFPLGSSPQLMKDKVQGGQLQVGLFQKAGAATTLGDAPILTLAMNLKGSTVLQGTVAFAPLSGKQAVLLNPDGSFTPISPSLGILSAN